MSCNIVAPVFLQYEQELLGFIRKRLKNVVESEEVLKQVLMKVYRHCEKLPEVNNTRAWLYRITRNAVADYYREMQRRQSLEGMAEPEAVIDEPLLQALSPLVPVMIEMLPSKYATPLRMSDIDEIPQQEIAGRLGLSLSATKSRIQRGRKKLKELFFECCYLELDRRGMPVSFAVKPHCKPLLPYQPAGEVALPAADTSCDC